MFWYCACQHFLMHFKMCFFCCWKIASILLHLEEMKKLLNTTKPYTNIYVSPVHFDFPLYKTSSFLKCSKADGNWNRITKWRKKTAKQTENLNRWIVCLCIIEILKLIRAHSTFHWSFTYCFFPYFYWIYVYALIFSYYFCTY